jgi:adenosylhomocysteine nucleosidase
MSLTDPVVVVLVTAGGEWIAVLDILKPEQLQKSPYGEWFRQPISDQAVIFMQGGWGKISAAASTQYAIDCWRPELLINLGTCGGISGAIEKGAIVLADRTLVYDIIEQMSDAAAAIDFYSTRLDLSWLKEPYPQPVHCTRLVSADRDILAEDIALLRDQYQAVAGDWESGAIAWVAQRNRVRCLILRGVSDLVDCNGGEAYGEIDVFQVGARRVMQDLLNALPGWLRCAGV